LKNSGERLIQTLENSSPIFWLAITHHRTHKGIRLNFTDNPYLRQIYCDEHPFIIIPKSTQCGISEYLHARAMGKAIKGRGQFYVLPTYDLMLTVVHNRFDLEIAWTPYYQSKVQEAAGKSESAKLKHIGKGTIKFVGSNTEVAFLEYPADDVIIDELDKCHQENIKMAKERQGQSKDPTTIWVSNPSLKGFGIDAPWEESDKHLWHQKCRSCNTWVNPDFFQHVVREVDDNHYEIRDPEWEAEDEPRIICHKCEKALDRYEKDTRFVQWVKTIKDEFRQYRGYQISKLFSSYTKLLNIYKDLVAGTKDPVIMQRVYNSELGLSFTHKGAKVNISDLDNIKLAGYLMPNELTEGASVMGIDVGNHLDVGIGQITPDFKVKIVHIGRHQSIDDLISLARRYRVNVGVIDALPETRLAKELCQIGSIGDRSILFMRCFYGAPGSNDVFDKRRRKLNVDRTGTLDYLKAFIQSENMILPENADKIEGFYEMMTAPVRIKDEKRNTYVWDEGGKPDHYFHSFNYMLLAFKFILQQVK